MTERILTLHPAGKQGTNISVAKYEAVRLAILSALEEKQPLAFQELAQAVDAGLGDDFDGSKMWYYTTVKLDLEARGEIIRQDKAGKQSLRLPQPNPNCPKVQCA